MREVAQRSDVALGTLYRYFPSKEFLLVSVMLADIGRLADRLSVRPPQARTRSNGSSTCCVAPTGRSSVNRRSPSP